MKKVFRQILCSALVMLTLNLPSYGWNALGHMTVAFVAYQKLTPQVRDRVYVLLRLNPFHDTKWLPMIPAGTSEEDRRMMIFMIAATWPDQIKGDNRYQSDGTQGGNRPPTDGTADRNEGFSDFALHKYWHFVDMPFSQDRTPLQDPPIPNAKDRITAFRAVLASTAADDLKSYDLAWLLHLVGDVHQPLHCTARFTKNDTDGDDGGNGVKLCKAPCKDNLHGFLDGALGNSPKATAAIAAGNRLPKANARAAANLDVEKWIDDSFKDARTMVYKNPPIGKGSGPFTLTKKYRTAIGSLAEKRVALAGDRLANILNNELK
jgi:hypothetical protein